jgi:hypothetical protein
LYINDLSYDPRDPLFEVPGLPDVRWGIQVFTTRNMYGLDPARTQITQQGSQTRLVCDQLSWGGQQQRSAGHVEATLTRDGGVLTFRVQAQHAEPLKVVKLLVWGLPEAALDQGWWQAITSTEESYQVTTTRPLFWNYPWREWLTPWACAGQADGQPFVCVSVRDPEVRAKRLYVHRPPYADSKSVVEICFEEDAMRWGSTIATPDLRVHICTTRAEMQADFDEHLNYVQQCFGLQPWDTRADVPAWMRDVRLVLNLHGQHWTGYVFNTFDRMAETLRFVTQHIPGKQLLAYIPGWEGRYYYAYPNYRPGEAMGGEAGFRRLVATANELGVNLMPMFGMHGTNLQVYPDWERSVFRSRTNSYVVGVNCPDWDTDRSGEDDQVFLNPGEPVFRQHLTEQVSTVIRDFGVSGVFLDTSACWFNDPRHNLIEGYRLLINELHTRHPDVLVAGEGWFDALLGLMPVNQTWLGISRPYRQPRLLTDFARVIGHLAEGAPGPVSTGVHERGFTYKVEGQEMPGHIRSLGIVDDTLDRYRDDVIAVCRAAASPS